MMSRTDLGLCYVLHSRKYRDTSLIVDVLSRDVGRMSMVVRGGAGAKSRVAGLLQPFIPLVATCFGQGELRTSGSIEAAEGSSRLGGDNLIVGLYVNELLYRLLGKFDPYPRLFDGYQQILDMLATEPMPMAGLRAFELLLLQELGYGISFDFDVDTGDGIEDDARYYFVAEEGFHRVKDSRHDRTYEGHQLRAIAGGRFDETSDRVAKQVIRKSLDRLLDGKPLHSRRLFGSRRSG